MAQTERELRGEAILALGRFHCAFGVYLNLISYYIRLAHSAAAEKEVNPTANYPLKQSRFFSHFPK